MTALTRPEANQVDMPDYVAVLAGASSPREHRFSAISDQHAMGLMQKMYASFKWTLYRVQSGRRKRVYRYPER